jgi:cell wall-associated NlpC family hydrolase
MTDFVLNKTARALAGAALLATAAAMPLRAQGAAVAPPQGNEPGVAEAGVAREEPAPAAARPAPFAAFSSSAQALRDSLVAVARAQVGKPYRFGGRSPQRGFDCSGLVQFIMAAIERELPRTAAQQAAFGRAVERDTSRLRPGDLLTFGTGRRASHIGIYVGNGRYVHASSIAGRVVESPIDRRAERVKPWRGARRVLPAEEDAK